MNILLVEDNILNQKVVSFNLKKFNYTVTSVRSGTEALEAVEQQTFNLILMDLMLPGMNGYEITQEIRKLEQKKEIAPGVPIIAITANTLDNDREKCLSVGMNDYLSKPFTAEQLIEKIRIYI